ncbi:hypothetical protein [Streptomyces sp. NRRL F-5053]|uniref:hypothetical protein n=1 Tax=Streptomyces sp. NRRL F-5053 TaxID=1463854 RepID=UPI0013317195|nr:hypothetical protein [Streptomyces sp. NRRL F-5053]
METVTEQENSSRARRRRGRWVALSLAAVCTLSLGASSCQDSEKKADRAEVCAKVLGQTLFNPFPKDAEKARKDVRERADKLDDLARQAPDSDLRKAIESTAASLRNANPKDHGARTVVGYLSEQNERLRELRKTCTDTKKY